MNIPSNIKALLQKREGVRKERNFSEADEIRKEIEKQGYQVVDSSHGSITIPITNSKRKATGFGKIAVFGSGELSTIGRKIHEYLIKDFPPPVTIALLETPAGYEDNPHHWYQKLETMLSVGLQNYRPQIVLIEALRKDGLKSTNNINIVQPLLAADYIHTGAGSPTYAVTHLRDSLVYQYLIKRNQQGTALSLASAATIAAGKYVLPVYELYFAGEDPHWQAGLDFFNQWGLNLTFIPHWNNAEGGKEVDTRFAYMGEKRFNKLLTLLPGPTTIIGLDEHTACIFDTNTKTCTVMGKGSISIFPSQLPDKKRVLANLTSFSFAQLQF
ncbi:cysteinyl-tRNA synthetase [Candidatus Woesebacteria bacterium]|nr:cysteinyl-tRNA synthetase [Candidatus Woesebacteria bacterium]